VRGLSNEFNVFAAPEDLAGEDGKPLVLTYDVASHYLNCLGDWHGHKGKHYRNDFSLYASLRDGGYNGEWVIPPRKLLDGKNQNGDFIQADNFITHKYKGAFKKAFGAQGRSHGDDYWYMSSTNRFTSGKIYDGINLVSDPVGGVRMTSSPMRCRPVRFVPVEGGPHA
jgi:hypothetical protein